MACPQNRHIDPLRERVGHDFGCPSPLLLDQPRIAAFVAGTPERAVMVAESMGMVMA